MRSCRLALAAAALAINPAFARQDFSNLSLWQSAAGTGDSIDFTEIASNSRLTTQYLGRGVRFDGTDATVSSESFADRAGARAVDNFLTINFAHPADAIAVGYEGQVLLVLYSGHDMVRTSYLGFSESSRGFGGVVSSLPFDRAVVSSRYQADVSIDDLNWSFVPSPSGAAFLLSAAAIAALRRR